MSTENQQAINTQELENLELELPNIEVPSIEAEPEDTEEKIEELEDLNKDAWTIISHAMVNPFTSLRIDAVMNNLVYLNEIQDAIATVFIKQGQPKKLSLQSKVLLKDIVSASISNNNKILDYLDAEIKSLSEPKSANE